MPSIPRFHFILDFDGTITKHDTLSQLAHLAYTLHPTPQNLPPWSHFTQKWIDDYKAHESRHAVPKASRTTLAKEVEWLRSLRGVEDASARRIVEAGVWDGLTGDRIRRGVSGVVRSGDHGDGGQGDEKHVWLRKGFRELFEAARERAWDFDVVSVNFSRTWCAAVVDEVVARDHDGLKGDAGGWRPGVWANEVPNLRGREVDGWVGEGREMRTSQDKLDVMREVIRRRDHGDEGVERVVVYLGDSTTDLECLVDADVGVCMRDTELGGGQRDLKDTCERVGMQAPPFTDWKGEQKRVWYVQDFGDVVNVLRSRSYL